MTTLVDNVVQARSVCFNGDFVQFDLSDGRTVCLPLSLPWLAWLEKATPEQQNNWEVEPGGYAVYWKDLDDGIEIEHLLRIEMLD